MHSCGDADRDRWSVTGFPARRSTRTTSMAGSGDKNLMTVPGNHTDVDPATQGFMFQQVSLLHSKFVCSRYYMSVVQRTFNVVTADNVPHKGPQAVVGLLHAHCWHAVSDIPAQPRYSQCTELCNHHQNLEWFSAIEQVAHQAGLP